MPQGASVLVVDDDEDIRATVAIVLEATGHSVASARDGMEALHWLRTHDRPSMILLDLMLPVMDAEEFVERLRADDALSAIPIVVMSGDAKGKEKAQRLAARAHLVKPVELAELEAVVGRFAPRSPSERG
jgi:CheY-like chemotaxis protein